MKLVKWIASIAALACPLAVSGVGLPGTLTNDVTFNAVFIQQGATNTVVTSSGTNTVYAPPKSSSFNAEKLISEIGTATTNNFSKAAKLVYLDPSGPPGVRLAIVDGTNFLELAGIMSFSPGSDAFVQSGQETGPPLKSKRLHWMALNFNDTSFPKGTLQFTLVGLENYSFIVSAKDTNGVSMWTNSSKVSSMTGAGWSEGNPFVAIGKMSYSGKGPVY